MLMQLCLSSPDLYALGLPVIYPIQTHSITNLPTQEPQTIPFDPLIQGFGAACSNPPSSRCRCIHDQSYSSQLISSQQASSNGVTCPTEMHSSVLSAVQSISKLYP
ncbi:hypothetical protein NPIL_695501 [Nephila pilipes]|uniref:Uncharacterized protein n=1 Tax=Nephila pilipes TaxID=299642 RepID=A0A8X6NTW3_NEPPI|nr:hypothetical protein NPIL_695501 [Nephila pilipes]